MPSHPDELCPIPGHSEYMDEKSCTSQIARDLLNLGVKNGDTILVHSSFKSLGRVPGGIETLILGLLRAIGESGTLLMPALCWALRPPEEYNERLTPTNVGAVAEYLRTRSGTLRSIHPTHSVCAVGKRAHEPAPNQTLHRTRPNRAAELLVGSVKRQRKHHER